MSSFKSDIPEDKLKGLFLSMAHRVDTSVPVAVNAYGTRSVSTNSQTLMKGAKRFQFLVLEEWNAEGQRDYLVGRKKKPLPGREILKLFGDSQLTKAIKENKVKEKERQQERVLELSKKHSRERTLTSPSQTSRS